MRAKDFLTDFAHDEQKAASFESDFCVSCTSYIATLLILDNKKFKAFFLMRNKMVSYYMLSFSANLQIWLMGNANQ